MEFASSVKLTCFSEALRMTDLRDVLERKTTFKVTKATE